MEKRSSRNNHFFAFLSRMKYINRWGLMRNTQVENIQEHSLQVAIVAHALAIIGKRYFDRQVDENKVAVLGIFHDCNEILTGDMPTPVKYFNPEISKAYKAVERVSKDKLLSMLPEAIRQDYEKIIFIEENASEYESSLVKAADRISAYIKCIEEMKAGNTEFKKAGESILKTIENLDMPEVDFFMKNFIDSFSLSLDELD